jgi:hypothetical protein
MPDLIAVPLAFSFSHGNHYFSAVVVVRNGSRGLAALQTVKFSARGGVDSIIRVGGSVVIEADAYGRNDPFCCPRSFAYAVLTWVGDGFIESSRCILGQRAFSSAPGA